MTQTAGRQNNAQPTPGSFQTEPSSPHDNETIQGINELLCDQYRIICQLGKGSQGEVFLAEDLQSHQKVAIKQLTIQSVKDWKLYDLFHREADTLKRLDMPGIAKLHEVREYLDIPEPRAFIVQDYIEGDPLQTFIAKGHRFQIGQIGGILLQLTKIIEKLHHCDPPVIHRDIKPSNILINYVEGVDSLQVHLIDFGAVANPQVKSGGSTVVGTYGYMAPEQLMGHPEPASDIYSLAIVAVYLLSGTPPEDLEVQDFNVLIDAHLEHLPHQITSVLRKMLEPKVDERLTDFEVIHKFFLALKCQKFDDIPELFSNKHSSNEYSLRKVNAYLQPGNIELWQALSDNLPRKLPIKYRKTLFATAIKKLLPLHYLDFSLPALILTVLMTGLISLMIKNAVLQFSNINIIELLFIIFVAIWIILSVIIYSKEYPKLFYEISNCRNMSRLLKTGRKSMATVIHMTYCSKDSSELLRMNNRSHSYTPTWEITYSFNPPDDASPDPIVHTVKTHALSEGLKEGSLIPIVYRIMDEKGKEVTSMPFPIPYCDYDDINVSEV